MMQTNVTENYLVFNFGDVSVTKRFDDLVSDKMKQAEINWYSLGAVTDKRAYKFSKELENALLLADELNHFIQTPYFFGRITLTIRPFVDRVTFRYHARSRDDDQPFAELIVPQGTIYSGKFMDVVTE